MAVKLKIYPRKKKGGRKGGRKRSSPQKSLNPMNDYATCVEVQEINNVLPNAGYSNEFSIQSASGSVTGIAADRFQRATILASQYKFYRCTRVEYTFQPLFNTFQAGAGASLPYLYTVMNRSGEQLPTTPLSRLQLQRMGATPVKLTKQTVKSYKPNTLQGTAASHRIQPNGGLGLSSGFVQWTFTPKYDEWQSSEILKGTYIGPATSNDSTRLMPANYYGHWYYIQQDDPNELVPVCDILVKVHWEFKDPRSPDDKISQAMSDEARLLPTGE